MASVSSLRTRALVAALAVMLLAQPIVAGAAPWSNPDRDSIRSATGISTNTVGALVSEIPGEPIPASPFSRTASKFTPSEDFSGIPPIDVYSVDLNQGELFTVELTMPSTSYLLLAMLPPGSTSVWEDAVVAFGTDVTYTSQRMSGYAADTGTYYIAVLNLWSDYAGSYTVAWRKHTLAGDDDIPGANVPGTSNGSTSGTLNWRDDPSDVYGFDVDVDQELTLILTGPSGTMFGEGGFDLYLYQAGSTSAWSQSPVKYSITEGTSSETIVYHCPPGGQGRVFAEVSAGITDGSYSLTWSTASPKVSRVSGANRYTTSYETSKANFATADHAVIATGAGFADALAASGLAGALDAPLLLAPKENASWDTYLAFLNELDRLGVQKCYVVGGYSAVSDEVDWMLDWFGHTVTRIAGADRYETARKVADEITRLKGTPGAAFVVRGDDFADALAASPFAYSQGTPILLTRPGSLNKHTQSFIDGKNITDVTIVGGTTAVQATVETALESLNGGFAATRIAGRDRYETASQLAGHAVGRGWGDFGFVGLATGANFPDALSGGAACGSRGGVLLLTRPASVPGSTKTALETNAASVNHAMLFGGAVAVTESVKTQIGQLLP